MKAPKKKQKTEKAEVKKQNQDYPNIPASSERIVSQEETDQEIKKTSKLNKEGKTDNIDHS